jgi:hypothetical protein
VKLLAPTNLKKMKTTRKVYLSAVAATVFWAAFAVFTPQSKALNSLTNGLVAYWPMDSILSGVLTPDLGPNAFDLLPYKSASGPTSFGTNIVVAVGAGPHTGAGAQNGTNALSFTAANGTLLAYINSSPFPISPGPNGTLPPQINANYTISFWVKAASGAPNTANRIYGDCDMTGGNGFWDIANDPGGTAQIDHFVRQSTTTNNGVGYGNFSGGTHTVTTNAPIFDNTWHNLTIVHQVITNMFRPVIDPTQFLPSGIDPTTHTPYGGQVAFYWTSVALDNQSPNWQNQVNTNQNYLVQEATNIDGPWTTIATVTSVGGGVYGDGTQTSYFDSNATNYPNAFYRVVQPEYRVAVQTIYMDSTQVDQTMGSEPLVNGGANFLAPYGPWHINSTSFGGYIRGSGPGGFTTALISDAAVWDRALSANEISNYMKDGITNASSIVVPPFVTLAGQFPSVANGDRLQLNWQGSKPPATLTLTPGVGDVTAISTLGIGNTNVVVTSNTVYQIVATKSGLSVTSSVPVNCVSNVAANWHYLDSFSYLSDGPINGQGGWLNPPNGVTTFNQNTLQVLTATSDGNKLVSFDGYIPGTSGNGGIAGRALKNYSSVLNTTNTLFFRFYIDPSINTTDPNTGVIPDVDLDVGITDQGIRDVVDLAYTAGCSVRLYRVGGAGGPIDLQAVDGTAVMQTAGLSSSLPSFAAGTSPANYSYIADTNYATGSVGNPNGLDVGHVYNVWIDVNNQSPQVSGAFGGGGTQTNGALYTVWLQEDNWPSRTNLFAGVITTNAIANPPIITTGALYSSRDYSTADATFPQSTTLGTVFLDANVANVSEVATNSVRFDDFYISTLAGPNSTVPVTAGSFVTP